MIDRSSRPFSLLVLDLDGTLLGPGGRVTDKERGVVELARKRGALVTLATGRVFPSACVFARLLGIQKPIIATGGAVIGRPDGSILYRATLSPEARRNLARHLGREKQTAYAALRDRFVTEGEDPAAQRYSRILRIAIEKVPDLVELLRSDPEVSALILRCDPGRAEDLEREWQDVVGLSACVSRTLPHLLEILPAGVSKGQALLWLSQRLGVEPDRAVAVGDGPGDLEMLHAAGAGVLVANAPSNLVQHACWVTPGMYADGVRQAVERFFPDRGGETR